MKTNQINQAIAKTLGWTNLREDFEVVLGRPPRTTNEYASVPDYYGDLNLCTEFRKILTDPQKNTYLNMLDSMIDPFGELGWISDYLIIDASAPQHCEAFLRTLNLWTSEQ